MICLLFFTCFQHNIQGMYNVDRITLHNPFYSWQLLRSTHFYRKLCRTNCNHRRAHMIVPVTDNCPWIRSIKFKRMAFVMKKILKDSTEVWWCNTLQKIFFENLYFLVTNVFSVLKLILWYLNTCMYSIDLATGFKSGMYLLTGKTL